MRVNRILLSSSLIVVALMIQVSVLARLHLPGAVPDLLLLTVLGLALVYGHVGGALIGFGAGLLADLAPPADHAVGRYALVLCVIGYLAGLVKPESGQVRSATGPMAVVVAAAVGSTCSTPASAPSSVTPPPAMSASAGCSSAPPCTTCCSPRSSSPVSWPWPAARRTIRSPRTTPPSPRTSPPAGAPAAPGCASAPSGAFARRRRGPGWPARAASKG